MKWIKKAAAAAAAASMALSLTACGSNLSWAAKIGEDTTVPIGLYIFNQTEIYKTGVQNSLLNSYTELSEQTVTVSDSDMKAFEYLDKEAKKSVKACVGAMILADEMDVTLSEEELNTAKQNAAEAYEESEEVFVKNGIAQTSIEEYYKDVTRKTNLFQAKYGPEGTEPVSDKELKAYFAANYATINFMQQYFYNDDGSAMSDKEIAALKKEYKSIKSQVEKGKLDFAKKCEEVGKEASSYKGAYTDSTSRFDTSDEDGQKILALKEGELVLLEMDSAIALVQKTKLDKDGSQFKQSRDTLLIEAKYDAFIDELVRLAEANTEKGADKTVQFNDKAFEKFSSSTRDFSELNVGGYYY